MSVRPNRAANSWAGRTLTKRCSASLHRRPHVAGRLPRRLRGSLILRRVSAVCWRTR
jgi:hypothetical protein